MYNGENLPIVDSFQYLGIILSKKKCTFNESKDRLLQQARKAMFFVLRKARKLSLPVDILLQFFYAMAAPILLYGTDV